jgi:hypothetical protein
MYDSPVRRIFLKLESANHRQILLRRREELIPVFAFNSVNLWCFQIAIDHVRISTWRHVFFFAFDHPCSSAMPTYACYPIATFVGRGYGESLTHIYEARQGGRNIACRFDVVAHSLFLLGRILSFLFRHAIN